MKTIHKYILSDAANKVPTFAGARFIHVANQREQIAVWAEVNTLERECMRTLHVVGTGHQAPPFAEHVGSALVDGGTFVFHIYAEPEGR
jgi:hypothetical protein